MGLQENQGVVQHHHGNEIGFQGVGKFSCGADIRHSISTRGHTRSAQSTGRKRLRPEGFRQVYFLTDAHFAPRPGTASEAADGQLRQRNATKKTVAE